MFFPSLTNDRWLSTDTGTLTTKLPKFLFLLLWNEPHYSTFHTGQTKPPTPTNVWLLSSVGGGTICIHSQVK